MAFVFRSDREVTSPVKKNENEIGPGQYLAQDKAIKNIRSVKVPFLSGSPKEESLLQPHGSPGPGSYFIDERLEKFNKGKRGLTEKEKENLEVIKAYQSLNKEDLPNMSLILKSKTISENLGFNVSDTRFKPDPNIYVPGPGHYLKSQDKTELDKMKNSNLYFQKLNKLPVFKSDLNDNKKIISIPNKHQSYGYELKEDGDISINKDPEKFKKFKGDKFDSVGPGNYDTKNTTWLKNCIDWGKSKTKKFSPGETDMKKSKLSSDLYNATGGDMTKIISNSFDNGDNELNRRACLTMRNLSVNFKTKVSKVLQSSNIRKTNRKFFYNEIMEVMDLSNKIDVTQRGISQETPGPGYYYQPHQTVNTSSFQTNKNFLSNQERFREKEVVNSLGPGSYYKEENWLQNKNYNKINKEKQSINNQSRDRSTAAGLTSNFQDNPGPGQYDSDIYYKGKKTFSSQSYFGSTEKRFTRLSNQRKENTPGPGYYLTANNGSGFNWMGDKSSVMSLRNKKMSYVMDKVKLKESKKIQNKENVPAVGSYNPQNIFNIEYKLKKKLDKFTLVETAFNSSLGQTRFSSSNEEFNGGPGFYYREKKVPNVQEYRPFNSFDKRFKEPKTDFVTNGPGSYNLAGYHDWNKRTFNILYLGN